MSSAQCDPGQFAGHYELIIYTAIITNMHGTKPCQARRIQDSPALISLFPDCLFGLGVGVRTLMNANDEKSES